MEKQFLAVSMRDNPVINEYLDALFQGGKIKEVNETKELLDYLDTMEHKFTELIEEVASLKETIQTLQNPETKSRLTVITDKLVFAVNYTKGILEKTKNSFRTAIKQSVDEFKSKGKHAVIKTIDTLHFKQTLQHIGRSLAVTNGFLGAFNNKVTEITAQTRNIKHNLRNIGRIMIGKDVVPYKSDTQKLNLLQHAGAGMYNKIEILYRETQSVYKKLDGLDKTSVKKDLRQIEKSKVSNSVFLEKLLSKEKSK